MTGTWVGDRLDPFRHTYYFGFRRATDFAVEYVLRTDNVIEYNISATTLNLFNREIYIYICKISLCYHKLSETLDEKYQLVK